MRTVHRVLVALCLAVLCAVAGAAPSTAATTDRVTWAVQPAVADGQQQRVSFRYELDPGATIEDSVTVTNFTAQPVAFRLYASDGVITKDGQFDLLAAATKPKDVGSWITLSQTSITVPASSSASVPFTVKVPANATPGDHPGGVVAALTRTGSDGNAQVSVENRVGARVHLRVAGELNPVLKASNVQVDYSGTWNPFQPGSAEITYTLENTGNVRLGSDQTTQVRGLFGIPLTSKAAPTVKELLPGSELTITEKVSGVWPLFRLRGVIDGAPFAVGTDVVDKAMKVEPGQGSGWAMPWSQLLLILVVVGGGYSLVIWRRRNSSALAAKLEKAREEGAKSAGAGESVSVGAAAEGSGPAERTDPTD